ncbi:hypothetical protein H2199_002155, partial [Coniosporium tulheliwenetii]
LLLCFVSLVRPYKPSVKMKPLRIAASAELHAGREQVSRSTNTLLFFDGRAGAVRNGVEYTASEIPHIFRNDCLQVVNPGILPAFPGCVYRTNTIRKGGPKPYYVGDPAGKAPGFSKTVWNHIKDHLRYTSYLQKKSKFWAGWHGLWGIKKANPGLLKYSFAL